MTSFGEPTGLMLGVFADFEYGTRQERLAPGERLVLYTDGVTEAEAPDGTMLEDEGFVALLREVATGDAAAVCTHVSEQVIAYEQGNQSDDVTVLVVGRPAGS